ncbi:reticulon-3 isoform X2 [Polyodon spathula]|uniref:reticulon-3 isoform X2 n=1 Tax=Polyodon spathula TaxID=7913 RepID=UPI001B7ED1F9|nr:reticulon-3 isoform X2 [Polyodon spathula]
MADSTQPEKIPSSQGSDGFADASAGHNAPSPGKDVKPTPPAASIDSFLSSPQPVSLIQSPQVWELIYWRDLKTSAAVFGVTLLLLLSLAAFSVVSVLSYLLLALLTVTISFRVFKSVVQAVQKSDEGHPFRAYIEKDISLSSESFSRYVDTGLRHCNCVLKQLSRLFLVEDLVESLKLAVFMWLMTYVGAVFNGITLLIIAHILVFSIPVVYEKYKTQIDHYVGIVHNQVKSVVSKVQAKVPGLSKRKPE